MTFINYLQGFALVFTDSALKDISKIALIDRISIEKKLKQLVAGSQGLDIKKLVDSNPPKYRLRVGVYRVIYEVFKDKIIVQVIAIDHRKDAYK
jgi:mRNA interferase RelE/StbE